MLQNVVDGRQDSLAEKNINSKEKNYGGLLGVRCF